MYEIIRNIVFIEQATANGKACVMATIVRTEGSSYRKKWTQMVVAEDMTYEGALSGGCVEREVLRQSNKLFYTKGNSIFEYDGTETLGCKGRIWVALEYIHQDCIPDLTTTVKKAHEQRIDLEQGISYDDIPNTFFKDEDNIIQLNRKALIDVSKAEIRKVSPQNRIVIVGGEFDSFILARTAQWTGFDVNLVVYKDYVKPPYEPDYKILRCLPEQFEKAFNWDERTVLILMTHSLNKDFQFLNTVINQDLAYIGALGPRNRRDEMIAKFKDSTIKITAKGKINLSNLKGPVGLGIQASTPEEIAISIIGELILILS